MFNAVSNMINKNSAGWSVVGCLDPIVLVVLYCVPLATLLNILEAYAFCAPLVLSWRSWLDEGARGLSFSRPEGSEDGGSAADDALNASVSKLRAYLASSSVSFAEILLLFPLRDPRLHLLCM